jgi:hypothetical protein
MVRVLVCEFFLSLLRYSEVLLASALGPPFVLEGFSTLNQCVALCLICSYRRIFVNKWYQSLVLVIHVPGFLADTRMLTTMKYDLPLLDFDT